VPESGSHSVAGGPYRRACGGPARPHRTFEELSAKEVIFVQVPSDRPYGVQAVMRDNTGNWF
jgi:hypothetical protein